MNRDFHRDEKYSIPFDKHPKMKDSEIDTVVQYEVSIRGIVRASWSGVV